VTNTPDGGRPDGSAPLGLTVAYRARFDECGPSAVLRSSGLMRWAQDCAWIHSERLGFGREWYSARGLWWLVRCAELNIVGDVAMGETISVTTTVVGYRKVWARRRTEFARAGGERVATALTDWVITDARGAPTRVPDEFVALMGGRVPTFTPGRVLLPPAPPDASRSDLDPRPADIDPMAHVNNAAYIDYFDESLAQAGDAAWATRLPRRYRLEYVAAAAPGERLTAETWPLADGFAHRLTGPAGAELLRATLDAQTGHDEFREAVLARRPRHAPGKDSGAG
jgi:acyl-ACP thioesterase